MLYFTKMQEDGECENTLIFAHSTLNYHIIMGGTTVKNKRLFKLFTLTLALLIFLLAAGCIGMQFDEPDFTINDSIVLYGGHVWFVIGHNGNGIHSDTPNSVTLLHHYVCSCDAYQLTAEFGTTSDYNNSVLSNAMNGFLGSINPKEQALIIPRTLEDSSGSKNHLLWALSADEWTDLGDADIRQYRVNHISADWGLRSVDASGQVYVAKSNGSETFLSSTDVSYNLRPALCLDLSKVAFYRDHQTISMNTTYRMSPIIATSSIRLAVPSAAQKVEIIATPKQAVQAVPVEETLEFYYAGATTGQNQSVSAMVVDDTGKISYYGRYVDCTSARSFIGKLSIPLSKPDGENIESIADGNYTLRIFSEQINGGNYVDFVGEFTDATLTVENGIATISNFGGTILTSSTPPAGIVESEPEPDPEVTYSLRTLTDNATGVSVTGSMTKFAKLTVQEVVLHAENGCSACDEIRTKQAAGELIILCDISVAYGYKDDIEVSIPVGDQYNGQTVTILHCNNGKLESVICVVQNGHAVGIFTKLSPFAVAGEVLPEYVGTEPPQTGDIANDSIIGIALITCAAGLIALIVKKRFARN